MRRLIVSIFVLSLAFLTWNCEQSEQEKKESAVQVVELNPGWNTFSSYVQLEGNDSITQVMKPLEANLIQCEGYVGFRDGMYNPSRKLNSLEVVKSNYVYLIKMKEAAKLSLSGYLNYTDTIHLHSKVRSAADDYAAFFNIPGKDVVELDDLYFEKPEKLILIHELKGGTYWPKYNINTLTHLKPGKGYLFIFDEDMFMTLKDSISPKSYPIPEEINVPEYLPSDWMITNYNPFMHLICLPNELLPEANEGDYIACFTQEDLCAGLDPVNVEGPYTLLKLYADDYLDNEPDGYREAEDITMAHYKVKDKSIDYYQIRLKKFPNEVGEFEDWNTDQVIELMPMKDN